ncbi:hypothetical protein [Paraburkholderia caballeronis]|uniref:Uncharacterized protein n=1 Tax=Paraburkholderia caballeronis TaxID=416943 RepID=A0A1H7TXH1_9BURK|nr:hypothetical protein [Paraburkholderia caballeronis]PXW23383.1 hypothetical protein C7403_110121 [Paraburkholderia caballeronis]PXW98376.1 hypothetical protein C7407_110121 [Paraburkholderia caballeronis]RAJ95107.1 hypothetical protein C7409_110122 [Paraburkholderia caballeronis]SEC56839.1 hypothetical protein SAMN05445871_2439 [Paraburkholderia caballeronis]SEL89540.1 hypothetical protein SAMN05192542_11711 [Paraburkholderia caballeronis]
MSKLKVRPNDFAMWLGARLLAESNIDGEQPCNAPETTMTSSAPRGPRSFASGLRFALVSSHAGSRTAGSSRNS